MSKLVIENGYLVTPEQERPTKLWLKEGNILHVGEQLPATLGQESTFKSVDASGCYVTPGLIDLQMNGGPDCDFWQSLSTNAYGVSEVRALRRELLGRGVTAFLPTLITADVDHLVKNIAFLKSQGVSRVLPFGPEKKLKDQPEREALSRMVGIHLEGPCLSPERPGVHPKEWIRPFTPEIIAPLLDSTVALFTAACEGDPEGKAIELLKKNNIVVALGHSNATFEEANKAFKHGATMITHTFNALPPLHHRKLGAVGAALLCQETTCCLIADGLHLDKAACALIFALKGATKTILVTDRASIGTSGGELVGSSISLDQAVQNMVNWNICSFAEAIRMASLNPARAIGLDHYLGSIEVGKAADLVFFNRTSLRVERVLVAGLEAKN
ncbi:amidohydrolase family protein [bacterium]|nr:amidohydrolase family protein [bacterium]MBP9810790.1 amidohydrolase family protein [bacterium]